MSTDDLPSTVRRAIATLYGAACHLAFAVAITGMVVALANGMQTGAGRLHGAAAAAADLLLLLQFPLLHSALLTARGRRALARLAPSGLGRDLASTTFALLASLQLLAVVVLWSPSGEVWWEPRGAARALALVPFALAWMFLVRALFDGGMALQSGFLGWAAVFRGRHPDYGPLREQGLFGRCRQPIYLGFMLTLWTGPVWTPDQLMVATAWSAYCILGPLLKERRYARIHGARFADYRQRVPYMIPRVFG